MKDLFLPCVLYYYVYQYVTFALVVCDGFKEDTNSEPTSQHNPRNSE